MTCPLPPNLNSIPTKEHHLNYCPTRAKWPVQNASAPRSRNRPRGILRVRVHFLSEVSSSRTLHPINSQKVSLCAATLCWLKSPHWGRISQNQMLLTSDSLLNHSDKDKITVMWTYIHFAKCTDWDDSLHRHGSHWKVPGESIVQVRGIRWDVLDVAYDFILSNMTSYKDVYDRYHSFKPMKSYVYDIIRWTYDIIVLNLQYHIYNLMSYIICLWYHTLDLWYLWYHTLDLWYHMSTYCIIDMISYAISYVYDIICQHIWFHRYDIIWRYIIS